MLSKLKQAINIKYFMVAYLGTLVIGSSLMLRRPMFLIEAGAMVLLYSLFDLLWTKLRDGVWYLPVSSWISGCVLSIVAMPAPPLHLMFLLPFLAVASKQLLHFGKVRHVFNPASFSVMVVTLFAPAAAWWAVNWGRAPLIAVIVVGLFILWRQSRWHVTLTFLATYTALSALFLLSSGTKAQALPHLLLQAQLLQGTMLFFSTVMLIEPITSSFPTRGKRMIYAALVGVFAVLATRALRDVTLPFVDPLIVGLLSGNLIASLLFLKAKPKPAVPQPVAPPAATPIQP